MSLFAGLSRTLKCDSGVRRRRHRVGKMLPQVRLGGGEGLAVLANSNNHKITFLLSLSSTKTQVFFSSFAPSSFFFLLSAAHNSEHYDGCPEALEWIQCRTGLHPPVHFMQNIALVSTVAVEKMPPPPSL